MTKDRDSQAWFEPVQHDSLLCGLDRDSDSDLIKFARPHLVRPGPQPPNQIGSLVEQLRQAFGPSETPEDRELTRGS